MTDKAAIELVHQRMSEIGKIQGEYHLELVPVAGTLEERAAKKIVIKAYNEHYFLINHENYFGLDIVSNEGDYFNTDEPKNNTGFEFTGIIEIKELPAKTWSIFRPDSPVVKPLDFVRVIIF